MKNERIIYTHGDPPKPGAYPVVSIHNGVKAIRYWTGDRWLPAAGSLAWAKSMGVKYRANPKAYRNTPHKPLAWGQANPKYLTNAQAQERVLFLERALRVIADWTDVRLHADASSKVGQVKTFYIHQKLAKDALGDRE